MNNIYSFFALISRMKYITRWSLMRNGITENIQEHSHMVTVIAHALAVIKRDIFGSASDPAAVVMKAIYHDSPEIFTGDLPTPVKYFDPTIMEAYKKVESVASQKLLTALPPEMRPAYKDLLSPDVDSDAYKLVKAADTLAAYIKCVEEINSGNTEFKQAAEQCKEKLNKLNMPEVDYFLERFIPAFELSLDELNFSIE